MEDFTLPIYSEEGTDIQTTIQELIASTGDLDLPITSYPQGYFKNSTAEGDGAKLVCQDIVFEFFRAINSKNQDVVAMMIENNLVTPNTTNIWGTTPLLAAVAEDNIRMVQCLVDFGAEIDGLGKLLDSDRTPLQLAASRGNLALVRLFKEVFHADDSIIAPDGELALRLAATNGHTDIVNYLPARRGGGWLRWKTHHAKAIRRIKAALNGICHFAKFFIWHIPKFLLWTIPKEAIILPAKKGLVWSWKNRHSFGPWCKKQAQEIPKRIKKAAIATKNGIKKIPKATVKAARKIWKCLVSLFTKRIPAMWKLASEWVAQAAKAVGDSLAHLFQRIASFLHSVFSSIITFFRSITLKDIWNGFCDVLQEVFVKLPLKAWSWIKVLPEALWHLMETLLGLLGQILYFIGWLLIQIVTYVPRELSVVLSSLGGSMGKAFHEILVWFNPKR